MACRMHEPCPGTTSLIMMPDCLEVHGLSTVRNVDRVYVLDEGRVTEEGSCFARVVDDCPEGWYADFPS